MMFMQRWGIPFFFALLVIAGGAGLVFIAQQAEILSFGRLNYVPVVMAGIITWWLLKVIRDLQGQARTITHELQETREGYSLAATGTNDGLWDWNIISNEIYFSPRYHELLGYQDGELNKIDTGWKARLHPEDSKRVHAAILEHLKNRTPYNVEYRMQVKGGAYRWFKSRGQAIWNENGKATRMAGSLRDIAERKQAQEALDYRLAFEALVTTFSTYFINLAPHEVGGEIQKALEAIGTFANEDLSFVFQLREGDTKVSLTHEWRDKNVPSLRKHFQNISIANFSWWIQRMNQDGFVHIPSVSNLLPAARNEKALFMGQAIRSCVAVPMRAGGTLIGFLGFAAVHKESTWSNDVIALLRIMGEVFANTLVRKQVAQALEGSEERYHKLFEESRDGIFMTDIEGVVINGNQAVLDLFGYTFEALRGIHTRALYAYSKDARELERLLLDQKAVEDYEVELCRKDGSHMICLLSISAHQNNRGDMVGYQACIRDITRRKQMEEALRVSEERFRAVVETATDAIITTNEKGLIVFSNSAAAGMFRYPPADLMGKPFTLIVPTHSHHVIHRRLAGERIICMEETMEVFGQRKDGSELPVELSFAAWESEGESFFTAILRDITKRKQFEEQLMHNALHDPLTGLPNRALFMDRLEQVLAHDKQREQGLFAVIFVNLNRFKVINESLRHAIGDKVLIALGDRLKNCVQPGDTVAHLGGDEFTILLEDIQVAEDAAGVAESIHQALDKSFAFDGHEIFTTASIGIVLSSTGYTRASDILSDADIAMAHAKKNHSHYEIFDAAMRAETVALHQLETDLRRAVENQKDFEVYYQPVVSLKTGRIAGFEALVRWHHPKRGMVSPDEFIPFAEETGMMIPIGFWVLNEACRQMSVWHRRHPSHPLLTISVNLFGRQFVRPGLVQQVQKVLKETQLESSSLKLEITERAIMDNAAETTDTLRELQKLNVQLHIDDFGTGYSSLSYLQHFPVNTLKIDRSFVSQMGTNGGDNMAIIKTIVTLAQSLNMDVIAEGVETKEQFKRLQALNCEYAQGYFFSRPVDQKKAEHLITSRPSW